MAEVLFVHDSEDYAITRGETWQSIGLSVKVCTSGRGALEQVAMGLNDTSVVVFHKDLGQYSHDGVNADTLVRALQESYPFIRLGVVSGEYPYGEGHVLGLVLTSISPLL